ncbi:MAG: alpha/beta hydrolase [Microbacteriaceae bacterium]|nr:alpha/beta hydrolase [Microbacteriaceae bacterium]
MITVRDLTLSDGRTLRVHDSASGVGGSGSGGPGSGSGGPGSTPHDSPTMLWHHGSPQTGALIEPLLRHAHTRGIRLICYGRPSYGGSSPLPERTVASAAADVAELADALGLDRFATLGASGGAAHALACAALNADRITAVASIASPAPFAAEGLDWFAGMVADGASLRAAVAGRPSREKYEESSDFDSDSFTERDYATLAADWAALGDDVGRSAEFGTDGLVSDDLALVAPWGFDVADIEVPTLIVQGGEDRIIPAAHGDWLRRHLSNSGNSETEFWLRARDGHLSVLNAVPLVLEWLLERS